MGDRIAVLQQGGILAQYAPPAELLMSPGERRSSRTSSAPTARSSASRSSACATSNLWKAPLVRAASRSPRRARRCGVEVPIRCWSMPTGARSAGCPSAAAGDVVREPTPARAGRRARRRAARRAQHLLATRSSTGRWSTRGPRRRRALDRAAVARDRATPPRTSRRRWSWRDRRRARPAPARDRSGADCVSNNGICPDWIADNFDRYMEPLWQHVYLTLVSVAIGFAIAFALALLAHRRRWLVGADHAGHRDPLHAAERRRVLPAAADHRPRQHDGDHRARRLHAADPVPQHHGRASTTCPPRRATPAAAWG